MPHTVPRVQLNLSVNDVQSVSWVVFDEGDDGLGLHLEYRAALSPQDMFFGQTRGRRHGSTACASNTSLLQKGGGGWVGCNARYAVARHGG